MSKVSTVESNSLTTTRVLPSRVTASPRGPPAVEDSTGRVGSLATTLGTGVDAANVRVLPCTAKS